MARRRSTKSSGSSGGELLLTGAVVVMVLASSAVFAAFHVAVMIACYVAPLLLLAVLIKTWGTPRKPPALPDPADYDDAATEAEIAKLLRQRLDMASLREQLYEVGLIAGRHLTKGSGSTRFDTRSRQGRELNDGLDKADFVIQETQAQARQLVWQVAERLPDPFVEYERWTVRTSARDAVWLTLSVSGVIGFLAANYGNDALLYGCLSAYPVFLVIFLVVRSRLRQAVDRGRSAAWRRLQTKWSSERYEDYIDPADNAQSEEPLQDPNGSPAAEQPETWNAVLGVASDATPETIRAAYHEAMKGYHPDKVAGLGAKLKALAEAETKKFNAAYQEARSLRGF